MSPTLCYILSLQVGGVLGIAWAERDIWYELHPGEKPTWRAYVAALRAAVEVVLIEIPWRVIQEVRRGR